MFQKISDIQSKLLEMGEERDTGFKGAVSLGSTTGFKGAVTTGFKGAQYNRYTKENKKELLKDELNLAEYPISKLGKSDTRDILKYERWVKTEHGPRHEIWEVASSAKFGLPNELADRIMVVLISQTLETDMKDRKVHIVPYQIIKKLGMRNERSSYDAVEFVLYQLKGLTIFSEKTFYSKDLKKKVSQEKDGFNIFDRAATKRGADKAGVEWDHENGRGYIIWGDVFWESLKSGAVKPLRFDIYSTLKRPASRKLYRLLDKYLFRKKSFSFDVFELSQRLGMTKYTMPSQVTRKLKPAFSELEEIGFLKSYRVYTHKKYRRIEFVKK